MTLRHTHVFLSLPPSIFSCPSVSPHFLNTLYSGSWDVIFSWHYGFKYFQSEIYEKKAYVFSWVTELLVLFFLSYRQECFSGKQNTHKLIRNYIRDLSSIFSIPSPVSMTSFPAQTVICIHFATRHETNGERWIRDVIWSWHKILKWQENDNTKRKTLYDLKLFKKFLTSGNERRQIPAAEPEHLL